MKEIKKNTCKSGAGAYKLKKRRKWVSAGKKKNRYEEWGIKKNIHKKQKEQKDTEDEDRARNWNRTNY